MGAQSSLTDRSSGDLLIARQMNGDAEPLPPGGADGSNSPLAFSVRAVTPCLGSGPGASGSGRPVAAEHAVFTSIRSAGGSGYRIIAASAGLDPRERQEITQRCPSHASLADEGAAAEALCTWSLRSGRHGIAWSRHAGLEHTGRGGQRVYTHVAVLDEAGYRRFDFNPLRVYAALLETLGDEALLEAGPGLETLHLPDPASNFTSWASAVGIGCNREAVFAMLEAVLAGQAVIVTGLGSAFAAVDAVMAILPLSLRTSASVCVGLKYSPARPAGLTVLAGECEEARRLTRGQNVRWLDAAALPASGTCAEGACWPTLARQWWTDGRRRELCRLAAGIDFEVTTAALGRIAAICQDADLAGGAEKAALEELQARYAGFEPANRVESELFERLRTMVARRQGR